MTRSFAGFWGLLGLCWTLGCDRPAPDLAEWTLADHHHQNERKSVRRQMGKPANYTQPSQRNPLVEVTWVKQCSSCHGKRGRGDGPQSPMVKAKDLTVREWQDSVTDEQLAQVIREGKNKMPAFNFPDSMVTGLVAHVRTLGLQKPRPGAPGSSGGAAPAEDAEEEAESAEAAKPAAAEAPKDGTAKNEPPPGAAHPAPAAGTPNPGH